MDLSVYVVTDRGLAGGRRLTDIIIESLRGGAGVIQLREKDISTLEFLNLALEIKKVMKEYKNSILIINDRVDIARACGADGVHLGQDDMPVHVARDILGPGAVIGVSVATVAEAERAVKEGVSYLGVSAIFSTPTKTDVTAVGLYGLSKISGSVNVPLVAIGGINRGNAGDVIRAGADGVAVVSEVMTAESPFLVVRELSGIVKSAKQGDFN